MSKSKILLQVTGSIAAFKAVALVSQLVQSGYDLEVVLTEGAEKFVGAASFEGLTRKPVHRALYDEGQMMAHIDLERWADLIVTYPATANTLSTFAYGRSDTLVGSIFLAHEFKKPYWVAPAMNQAMLQHPAVQKQIQILRDYGVQVFEPTEGNLACGEIGSGRLIEPQSMLEEIHHYFKPKHITKNILITSGGTSEPIDDVRSITNFSTGQTGCYLAEKLAQMGHKVTLIQSKNSKFQPAHRATLSTLGYVTTQEFTEQVKTALQTHSYDLVIHAAAVADYHVEKFQGKISSQESLTLKLIPNPKVLDSIQSWSQNPKVKVLSFKLTSGQGPLHLERYPSDWVIHNELSDVQGEKHLGALYQKGNLLHRFKNKNELTEVVSNLISKELT